MPRGSHRTKHDAAKAAAMLRADPPAGRRISAGVLTAFVQDDCEILRSEITKTNYHEMCFSPTLWFLRGAQDPIPSRTRTSNPSAPMVLSLKTWESRSLQGLPKTQSLRCNTNKRPSLQRGPFAFTTPKHKPSSGRRSVGSRYKKGGPLARLLRFYQTIGCVWPLETLTKPSGASGEGATSTQRQGEQVSVAKAKRSGKPGHQRGEKVGSYIHSMASP